MEHRRESSLDKFPKMNSNKLYERCESLRQCEGIKGHRGTFLGILLGGWEKLEKLTWLIKWFFGETKGAGDKCIGENIPNKILIKELNVHLETSH